MTARVRRGRIQLLKSSKNLSEMSSLDPGLVAYSQWAGQEAKSELPTVMGGRTEDREVLTVPLIGHSGRSRRNGQQLSWQSPRDIYTHLQ